MTDQTVQDIPEDIMGTIRRTVKNEDYLRDAGIVVGSKLLFEGRDAIMFSGAFRALWLTDFCSFFRHFIPGFPDTTRSIHHLSILDEESKSFYYQLLSRVQLW